jgi:hypothetical protein
MLRGNRQKMPEICGDMLSNKQSGGRGSSCLFLAGNPMRNASGVSTYIWAFPTLDPLLCKHCFKGFQYSTAFPRELPILFRYCSNRLKELLSAFHNMSWHRLGHFLYIFSWSNMFLFIKLKNRRQQENKNISGSSPNYDPSNHTTYNLIQTVATVPLMQPDQSESFWGTRS